MKLVALLLLLASVTEATSSTIAATASDTSLGTPASDTLQAGSLRPSASAVTSIIAAFAGLLGSLTAIP